MPQAEVNDVTLEYAWLGDSSAPVIVLIRGLGTGISLGGMVAQLLGIEHGPRVDCLFSVMSGSGNPDVPTVSADMLPYLVEQASGRDAVIALSTRNRALFGSPGYPESEAHRQAQSAAAYDRCYCPEGTARQMRAATADGSRVERLATIRRPTLVIHGQEDPLVSVAAGRDTAAHIPGAELNVIAGMGHNIPVALGAQLAELTTAFIARHSA